MLNKFHTKIVGTTFEGRDKYVRAAKMAGIKDLILRREPDNVYDEFAVAVDAKMPNGAVVQLGYISNKERECNLCGRLVPPPSKGKQPVCPNCGAQGEAHFSRNGLATELSTALKDGIRYRCEVSEYTGDTEEKKSIGVNIYIERLEMDVSPTED